MFTAGLNGAIAVQRAIDNTTQNITNASNPAYHRLETQFQDLPIMSGAVSNAHRAEDAFLEMRYRAALQEYSANAAVKESTENMNAVFETSSLKKAYQDFVSASNAYATDPNMENVFKASGENFAGVLQDFEKNLHYVEQQLKKNIESTEREIETINKEIQKLQEQPKSDVVTNQISYFQLQVGVLTGKRNGFVTSLGEVYPPVKKVFDDTYKAFSEKVNSEYGKEIFGADKTFNYQSGDITKLNKSLDTSFLTGVDSAHQYVAERAVGAGYATSSSQAAKVGLEESLQKSVGVDTNAEMIKLEQYKRQYEAIMKTIAAKDEMIGSLLAIV